MRRRGLLYPAVVALIAVVLGLLLTRDPDPAVEEVDAPEERPDFFFEGFRTVSHDADGRPEGTLRGTTAHHYPGPEELRIQDPDLTLRSRDGLVWEGQAPRGTAWQGRGEILLHERVAIQRPPQNARPPLEILTRDLLVDLEAGEARTDAPVRARDPAGVVHGVGMTLDYRADRLRLHAEARGTYEFPNR